MLVIPTTGMAENRLAGLASEPLGSVRAPVSKNKEEVGEMVQWLRALAHVEDPGLIPSSWWFATICWTVTQTPDQH